MIKIVWSEFENHPLIHRKTMIRVCEFLREVGENDFPVGQANAVKDVLGMIQYDPKGVNGGVRHGVKNHRLEYGGSTSVSRRQFQTFFLLPDEVLA